MTTESTPSTPLTKAALRGKIFSAAIKSEQVTIPSRGITVEVRGMSAGARGRVLNVARLEDNSIDFEKYFPAILVETIFDIGTGDPVFTAADVDSINALPNDVVETLSSTAQRLSGLGDAAKVLEKNSAPTTAAGASSD